VVTLALEEVTSLDFVSSVSDFEEGSGEVLPLGLLFTEFFFSSLEALGFELRA
jgi:hypothetical protein